MWTATIFGTLREAPAEHLRILGSDMRFALRRFRLRPALPTVAVLSITIGLGATTAVYSLVDRLVLRPLPYLNPERLVHLRPLLEGEESMPGPVYEDLGREARVFDQLFTMTGLGSVAIGGADGPERVRRLVVSPNYFRALGVRALRGRVFESRDEHHLSGETLRSARPDDLPVGPVVISHDLWTRRYGGDPDALGSRLDICGRPYEIVGVLPPGFRVLTPPSMELDVHRDIFYLSNLDPGSLPRDLHYLEVFGRLAPGVELSEAQAVVDAFCARQRARHSELRELGYRIRVEPLHRQVVGELAPVLWTLFGSVGCVLLMACANVASLMLAGGATRQGELGMRVALGASRERLVRLLMTESLLIAAAGAVLGLGLAFLGLDVLASLHLDSLQRFERATIDRSMLTFAFVCSLGSALLFGIIPSVRYSRPRLEHALVVGGKTVGGLLRRSGRSWIVVGEISLCFALLAGTVLLYRTLEVQTSQDPGLSTAGVASSWLDLPSAYSEPEQRIQVYRRLTDRLLELPSVESIGLTTNQPLDGSGGHAKISTDREPESELLVWEARITPGYLETIGIALRSGRLPEWGDFSDPDSPFVVVDETLAERLWPGENAVGRQVRVPRLRFTDGDEVASEHFWAEVIGVVGSVPENSLAEPKPETIYLGLNFTPTTNPILVVRAGETTTTLEPVLLEALRRVDERIAASPFRDLDRWLDDATADVRFSMTVLGLFAATGLMLAAVGLYSLVGHSVRRGAGEIGLRLALGASRVGILRVVLAHTAKLTALGLLFGLLCAFALGRALRPQLFGVGPHDPLTLAIVALVLCATSLVACIVPALRALRVNPMDTLRTE